jgi:hypothetical protein
MTDPDERDPLDFEDTPDRAALLKQLAVEERDLFRNATTLAGVFLLVYGILRHCISLKRTDNDPLRG